MRVVGGVLKDYAWGPVDGLLPWSGHPTGSPQAELWFGDHHSGSSPLLVGDHPTSDSPLLVKFLAAAKPLSIQVHPDARLIATLWSDGADGVLSDGVEKCETLLALTDFVAICGLRASADAAGLLALCDLPEALGPAAYLADPTSWISTALSAGFVPDLTAAIGAMSPSDVEILTLITSAFPGDAGLLLALVMQPMRLVPGDAICVPTGVPHAYVRGLAVEVMAASDNVLRLGLTPKKVSVAAGTAALRLDRAPMVVLGAASSAAAFPVIGTDWPYSVQVLATGTVALGRPGDCTILPVTGPLAVSIADRTLSASPGQAVLVEAGESDVSVKVLGTGVVPAVLSRASGPTSSGWQAVGSR
jgi:mannose-6-phosphate isomerase